MISLSIIDFSFVFDFVSSFNNQWSVDIVSKQFQNTGFHLIVPVKKKKTANLLYAYHYDSKSLIMSLHLIILFLSPDNDTDSYGQNDVESWPGLLCSIGVLISQKNIYRIAIIRYFTRSYKNVTNHHSQPKQWIHKTYLVYKVFNLRTYILDPVTTIHLFFFSFSLMLCSAFRRKKR